MEPLRTPQTKIVERVATGATILIWAGVLLVAVGLTMAYLNVRAEQQAIVQAESLSFVVIETSMPTASSTATDSSTPTRTPMPTDTPRTATPTSDHIATLVWSQGLVPPPRSSREVDPTRTPTQTPTAAPTHTPTSPPVPTPTPDKAIAPSAAPNRIVIPSIDVDAPVVSVGWKIEEQGGQNVSVWESPDNAAGWHKTSSLPGNAGNVVLNGHNNIRGEVFRDLVDLEPQSVIQLYIGDTVYHYSVVEKHILKERGEPPEVRYRNAQWIAPTEDERLTLVTCWPYTSNTHRLIVVAKPHEPEP